MQQPVQPATEKQVCQDNQIDIQPKLRSRPFQVNLNCRVNCTTWEVTDRNGLARLWYDGFVGERQPNNETIGRGQLIPMTRASVDGSPFRYPRSVKISQICSRSWISPRKYKAHHTWQAIELITMSVLPDSSPFIYIVSKRSRSLTCIRSILFVPGHLRFQAGINTMSIPYRETRFQSWKDSWCLSSYGPLVIMGCPVTHCQLENPNFDFRNEYSDSWHRSILWFIHLSAWTSTNRGFLALDFLAGRLPRLRPASMAKP